MPDVQSCRDAFGYSCVFSAMDLKSGFLNLPVGDGSIPYLGLITQDGLFVWQRMAQGLLGAPLFFQYCIDKLLS